MTITETVQAIVAAYNESGSWTTALDLVHGRGIETTDEIEDGAFILING